MADNKRRSKFPTDPAEYKSSVPTVQELARDIAAFANTQSGRIMIGYDPDFDVRELSANQIGTAEERAYEALRSLNPTPNVKITKVLDEDIHRLLAIIEIEQHPTPVLCNGRYYIREGNKTRIAEEDLIDSLSETVPSYQQNIFNTLQSEEPIQIATGDYIATVQGEGSATVNINTIYHEIEEKPQIDLTGLLSESIKRTRDDLTTERKERLLQARITFIVAIVVLVLAIMLVFVGVILIFSNKIQEGVVSSVASIVTGIVSGLAFVFNKQANDRLDEYASQLSTLEKSYTGMQYISLITDVKIKDEAIRDLAKSISMGQRTRK